MISGGIIEAPYLNPDIVRNRCHDICSNLLGLRTNSEKEKLVLLVDSLSDLEIFRILLDESRKFTSNTCLLYFKTNTHNSAEETHRYLDPLRVAGISIEEFDCLTNDKNILTKVVNLFARCNPSVGVADLTDDYDIRQAINDYSAIHRIPILEIPTINRISVTSDIFSEDYIQMKAVGESVRDALRSFNTFRMVSPDGTDLTITVNPGWISESDNNFTVRYWDDPPATAPQDNPPGEVCTNIRDARGTLVLYQFDEEVIRFWIRNHDSPNLSIDRDNYMKFIYNPNDPVSMNVIDGFIDTDSINTSLGIRSQILKYYLEHKQKEDQIYETEFSKNLKAACKASEIAIGINSKANNPEDEISPGVFVHSTLITEKKSGVWHIAFGNTPCPDEERFFNHSSSHIDCGLRNPDLQVYGLKDNQETLLFSSNPECPGPINTMLSKQNLNSLS